MLTATQAAPAVARPNTYTASIVAHGDDLARLREEARHLLSNLQSICQPEFFLATVSKAQWAPRIIAVRQDGKLLGLVYTKERKIGGLPTGVVYADSTLGAMVIASPIHQGVVLLRGLKALLTVRGTRGLRILVPPDGFEIQILRELKHSLSLDCHEMSTENHSVLPMGTDFDHFLEGLHTKTRRNFRYFRRRSEAAGNVFLDQVSLADFETAAMTLFKDGVVGANAGGIARAMDIFRAAERPLLTALRGADGEWLSLLGGWYESGRVVIFLQINSDKKHPGDSLSLVMRSYVIQLLIARGYQSVLWWAGVGAPISNYVQQVPTTWVYLDKRNLGWRTFRRVLDAHRSHLPVSLSPVAEWIVPSLTNGVGSTTAKPE